MASYILPSKGAFQKHSSGEAGSPFSQPVQPRRDNFGYDENGWPLFAMPEPEAKAKPLPSTPSSDDDGEGREDFDLNNVQLTAEDYERHHDADKQMRELLAGAVGDGEGAAGTTREEGDDVVKGFAKDIRLMPHQVRGVHWMRERESGRKRGGILADDMGLGKTVQTLARIVEGQPTAAEKRLYKGGTLIICPLAVMEQWATECRTKTENGLLKVTTHHGPKRAKSAKELRNYDVVITTFQVLVSEHKAKTTGKSSPGSDSDSDVPLPIKRSRALAKERAPALFDLKWLRVVIDEAQNIKNRKTQAAEAAYSLTAKFRWCLTGTPIQNNVDELYSLFKFLRAKPLDDWSVFRSRVSVEVTEGRTGIAMKRLHVILKAIMLRRTKNATIDGKPILNLPERNVDVVECEFDSDERAFYTALEAKTSVAVSKFITPGTVLASYQRILTLLLGLRQACDHPSLVVTRMRADEDVLEEETNNIDSDAEADGLADLLAGMGLNGQKKSDAEQKQTVQQSQSYKGLTGLPPSSAKIRMILKLLAEIDERSAKKEKTIVFSQFTRFLDIIERFLVNAGVKYTRYDGTMSAAKREEVLHTIRTSKTIRVILISFKAGSTGLNLTCCNNVILTDLWWNPALEDQAFDRAHRLGQQLDVNIYKLTISATIEDRILTLQTQKRELAEAALSGTGVKNMKLTMSDIMYLFKMG
ncbi:hypothetical protein CspeluHIS016_0403690 [Cutaneotrichosporon spelunceum]|uniref:Uncharacterized protein n=1 Tax=Cutaneotrichosporon spelunceum TaxID=1672016 RepID=A0AAD3TW07_9TREE|nr:hypothetical protein CspeluHIS016_0403690 [Cutaneotrichosporon spelunceum]